MAEDMFRPPINRAMRVLDRSFFHKRIPLSAARILDDKNISRCRADLQKSKDALALDRCGVIRSEPGADIQKPKKCILLRPEVTDQGDKWPWSSKVAELQDAELVDVIPYDIDLDYNYWTYHEIASAILPEGENEEVPSGFTQVGHVAHLNLRDKYLQWKTIIGELLLDKNPGVRTVINKVDDVGEESEYRTFSYEVLAGEDDMNVEIREADCTFCFDYSKVYWNSRLNTEHERLVATFDEGDAVCDVMAGIGPFAVPAGKSKVFCWANDLNPDSYHCMVDAIKINKVGDFVRPFNEDGHSFIRSATLKLLHSDHTVKIFKKQSRTEAKAAKAAKSGPEVAKVLTQPRVFSHYVMNLPATAETFLPSFIGLYSSEDRDLLPQDFKLPMVHCYCFSTKSDDNVREGVEICERVSRQIGHKITPDTPETTVYDVRDVAPNKRMFCASFRLPEEVAFRTT